VVVGLVMPGVVVVEGVVRRAAVMIGGIACCIRGGARLPA